MVTLTSDYMVFLPPRLSEKTVDKLKEIYTSGEAGETVQQLENHMMVRFCERTYTLPKVCFKDAA